MYCLSAYIMLKYTQGDDMGKFSNMLKILSLLQTEDILTTNEIANYLNISQRNVKAYIQTLKEANIPIRGISGRSGGVYLSEDYYLYPPRLDKKEYEALLLAEDILTKENGFVYEGEYKTALSKIKWAMGMTAPRIGYLGSDANIYSQGPFDICDDSMVKNRLLYTRQAIKNRNRLRLLYYTPNKKELKWRDIDPYGIINRNFSWYLVGYCHLRSDIRVFKVIRIKELHVLEDTFEYPEDFSTEKYMENILDMIQGAEYNVKIKFFHPASTWVEERMWLPSQKITRMEDDSIIFEGKVKGLTDIKRWVMGYGRLARVIEPKKLKDAIFEEASYLLQQYEENDECE